MAARARWALRGAGETSHWRDCHSAGALSPSLLKHLTKAEGGAAEWQSRRPARRWPARRVRWCGSCWATLAVGEAGILLHPPLPLAGVSIVTERERQQNDTTLADGQARPPLRPVSSTHQGSTCRCRPGCTRRASAGLAASDAATSTTRVSNWMGWARRPTSPSWPGLRTVAGGETTSF